MQFISLLMSAWNFTTGFFRSSICCVKSFWSAFSRIWTEYGPEKTLYLDTFHALIITSYFYLATQNYTDGAIQLIPEPLFTVSSDQVYLTSICGTANGRIFLSGKDNCLYELVYKVWWGILGPFSRKCGELLLQ